MAVHGGARVCESKEHFVTYHASCILIDWSMSKNVRYHCSLARNITVIQAYNTVTGLWFLSHRISDDLESRMLPCAIVLDGGVTLAWDSETTKDPARDL